MDERSTAGSDALVLCWVHGLKAAQWLATAVHMQSLISSCRVYTAHITTESGGGWTLVLITVIISKTYQQEYSIVDWRPSDSVALQDTLLQ